MYQISNLVNRYTKYKYNKNNKSCIRYNKYPVSNTNKDTNSNNKDVYIWNKKETLLLICLYKEHEEMFTSGKMKQHSCRKRIGKEMAKKVAISLQENCTKFQTLKRTYKQIKDHNNKSGIV
ncbi:uncharacterized protein LOC118647807 [Monomorium pharaonis]|uniref:uncharacterized protein LOC118647807 n=1 Tax=Monomorium pharaonis TaxID=307658 RepID=UPI001746CF29|nr:uncharacterized protein LOC118647807 [Monomorium pharaonis]